MLSLTDGMTSIFTAEFLLTRGTATIFSIHRCKGIISTALFMKNHHKIKSKRIHSRMIRGSFEFGRLGSTP